MMDEEYCVMQMFADDIAMVAEKEEEMDKMLDRVHEYTKKQIFRFNEKKSRVMVMARRQQKNEKRRWWVGDKEVNEAEEYNYPGVLMN